VIFVDIIQEQKISELPVLSKTTEMKIGKINYIVTAHYNPNGCETAEQKLIRLIANRITEDAKKSRNAVELSI